MKKNKLTDKEVIDNMEYVPKNIIKIAKEKGLIHSYVNLTWDKLINWIFDFNGWVKQSDRIEESDFEALSEILSRNNIELRKL